MYPRRRQIGGQKQTRNLPPSVQIRGPSRKKDCQIGGLLPSIKMAKITHIKTHFSLKII